MKLIQLMIMAALISSTPGIAGDFVVVVNTANTATSVTTAELKRLFTGKKSDIGGVKAVPINQSLDGALAKSFLQDVTGFSADEYKEFWVAAQVKGEGSAPMIQKSSDAVIAIVSQIPGAIGYVEKDKVTAAVKALTVGK